MLDRFLGPDVLQDPQVGAAIFRIFACLIHRTLNNASPKKRKSKEKPVYLCNHVLLNEQVLRRAVQLLGMGLDEDDKQPTKDAAGAGKEEAAYVALAHGLGAPRVQNHDRQVAIMHESCAASHGLPPLEGLGHHAFRNVYGEPCAGNHTYVCVLMLGVPCFSFPSVSRLPQVMRSEKHVSESDVSRLLTSREPMQPKVSA